MVLVCGSCGEVNPDRARFCLGCGSPVTVVAAARQTRRTVTVLFCDLVGSTALAEDLDPESVRAVMALFFSRARVAVEAHGGTVEKFIGDAVVGAFGVPVLHEDDALRGVRAAVALRDSVVDLNTEIERRWGTTIGVRIGVNTGEVVAGDPALGQFFVSGDAVNTAARLEQSAAPQQILIGEATRRLVGDAVRLEPVAPLPLRGKRHVVPAWQLHSLVAADRVGDGPDPWPAAALVGREGELTWLTDQLGRCVARRSCRTLTVLGAPGVGKSRLVAEFVARVPPDAVVTTGRCLPYGDGIAYWPVAEATRRLARLPVDADPATAGAALAALLPAGSGEIVEALLGVLGLTSTAPKDETFRAVRRLFEVVAADRPLVLVLDDVQWAEPTLVELVEHLRSWTRDAAVLVVLVARPELQLTWPHLVTDLPDQECLSLHPLPPDASRRLVADLLGRDGDPDLRDLVEDSLVDQVVQVAEGNPLFVAEILRMLTQDGVLHRGSDSGRAQDAVEVAVPPTIQALLAARLDRLPGAEQVVVERAAVVGKQFERAPLLELAPETVRPTIDEHLGLLMGRELVLPDPTAAGPGEAFQFSHLLIRDAAYHRLLKHERAALHELMAGWLASDAAARLGPEVDDLLGYHLEQAHRYLAELGRLDRHGRDLGRRAGTHLATSGRRALAGGDHAGAAALFARAWATLPAGDPAGPALLLDIADCAAARGDAERATTAVASATTLVEEVTWPSPDEHAELQARLAVARCRTRMLTDPEQLQDDVRQLQAALDTLPAGASTAARGQIRTVLGHALALTGRLAEAEHQLDLALVSARQSGDAARAREVLLLVPVVALWGPLPVVKATGRLTDTLRVLRQRAGNRLVEAEALRCMGLLEAMRGRLDPARALLESAHDRFTDLGSWVGLAETELSSGLVELMADRLPQAGERLTSAHHRFADLGVAAGAGRAAAWTAEQRHRSDDLSGADAWATTAQRATGERTRDAAVWLGVRAKLHAGLGDLATSHDLADRAAALVEDTDALTDRADATLTRAQVAALGGDPERAAELGRAAQALYAAKGHLVGAARAREGIAT